MLTVFKGYSAVQLLENHLNFLEQLFLVYRSNFHEFACIQINGFLEGEENFEQDYK